MPSPHLARVTRRAFVGLLALSLSIAGPGCQNGQVDENQVCAFQCDYTDPNAILTLEDVVQVIVNAYIEAQANGVTDLTISVNDHLNNVLAVFDTNAATVDYTLISSVLNANSTANSPFDAGAANGNRAAFPAPVTNVDSLNTALDGIYIPNGYAAISKAGTANYFSTQGNAFSTRTANTLIQQNFVPGETDRPGGPLFAVQIAQLVCSDINQRQSVDDQTNTTGAPDPTDLIGPRRLPVGFAADPGGLPLYKDGIPELDAAGNPTGKRGKVVVGAVGIEFNGVYGLDKDATNQDRNLEERIAVGATRGYEADKERRANRITVAGRALRFFDDGNLRSSANQVPDVTPADVANIGTIQALLDSITASPGRFVFDQFYFPFTEPRPGVNFLTPASGVIPAPFLSAPSDPSLPPARAEILVDSLGAPRYPAIASTNPLPGAGGLTATDVQELLVKSLLVAENTRAQTRTPLGGQARIDVAVVDLDGTVLGFARSQDALLDGIDVTIAKTRQAAFFSKANSATQLQAALDPLANTASATTRLGTLLNVLPIAGYVTRAANFLGVAPTSVFDGQIAWSSIGLGGISNPDFPPGILDAAEGPLSRETTPSTGVREWSIFSTGLQTEIVLPGIALGLCEEVPDLANALDQLGVIAPAGVDLFDTSAAGVTNRNTFCGNIRTALIGSADPGMQLDCIQGVQDSPAGAGNITGLQNGFHIFQGAVPIYREDGTLVGAIGVSGDGAEQDDFVPFVALDEVGKSQRRRGLVNPIGNAFKPIRNDTIEVVDIFLRYVICPVAPFLNSNEQNACEGR